MEGRTGQEESGSKRFSARERNSQMGLDPDPGQLDGMDRAVRAGGEGVK